MKTCTICQQDFLPKTPTQDTCSKECKRKVVKVKKPLKQVSEKKKKRIAEEGSEWEFFKKIARANIKNYRNEAVVIAKDLCRSPEGRVFMCMKRIKLEDLGTENFAHIISKNLSEDLRYDKLNIEIVSRRYHHYAHTGQYLIANFKN